MDDSISILVQWNPITAQWRRTPVPRLQESYTIQKKKDINNNNNISKNNQRVQGGLVDNRFSIGFSKIDSSTSSIVQ